MKSSVLAAMLVSVPSDGENDKALAEDLETTRVNPDLGIAWANLIQIYTQLGRLNDAKTAYQQAVTRKLDGDSAHLNRYAVAFLEGDAAEMQRQLTWGTGKAGVEDLWRKKTGKHLEGSDISMLYVQGDELATELYDNSALITAASALVIPGTLVHAPLAHTPRVPQSASALQAAPSWGMTSWQPSFIVTSGVAPLSCMQV